MSRTAVLALVLVAASASAATAGGFVGLGVGTGAASSGDYSIDEHGRSGRLMLGYRFGRFSIEGLGTRYGMITPDAHQWDGTTLGLAGRYNLPLGDKFEAFGRLGLQRTSFSDKNYDTELAGSGFLVGAGFEYRIPLPTMGIGIFVDYTIQRSSISGPGADSLPVTSRLWTLGATLSF